METVARKGAREALVSAAGSRAAGLLREASWRVEESLRASDALSSMMRTSVSNHRWRAAAKSSDVEARMRCALLFAILP
jgi:hypothetical protein